MAVFALERARDDEQPSGNYISNAQPVAYADLTDAISVTPDFVGQEDLSLWTWLPEFGGITGSWRYAMWDNNSWSATVNGPLSLDVVKSSTWRKCAIAELERHPAFNVTKVGSPTALVAGDNLVGGTQMDGVEVVVTAFGPKSDKWYGASGVGKWGWITEVYENGAMNKLNWINFQTTRYTFDQGL